jgi:hypothetical protein
LTTYPCFAPFPAIARAKSLWDESLGVLMSAIIFRAICQCWTLEFREIGRLNAVGGYGRWRL